MSSRFPPPALPDHQVRNEMYAKERMFTEKFRRRLWIEVGPWSECY